MADVQERSSTDELVKYLRRQRNKDRKNGFVPAHAQYPSSRYTHACFRSGTGYGARIFAMSPQALVALWRRNGIVTSLDRGMTRAAVRHLQLSHGKNVLQPYRGRCCGVLACFDSCDPMHSEHWLYRHLNCRRTLTLQLPPGDEDVLVIREGRLTGIHCENLVQGDVAWCGINVQQSLGRYRPGEINEHTHTNTNTHADPSSSRSSISSSITSIGKGKGQEADTDTALLEIEHVEEEQYKNNSNGSSGGQGISMTTRLFNSNSGAKVSPTKITSYNKKNTRKKKKNTKSGLIYTTGKGKGKGPKSELKLINQSSEGSSESHHGKKRETPPEGTHSTTSLRLFEYRLQHLGDNEDTITPASASASTSVPTRMGVIERGIPRVHDFQELPCIIPADMVILECSEDLRVDHSVLIGTSFPTDDARTRCNDRYRGTAEILASADKDAITPCPLNVDELIQTDCKHRPRGCQFPTTCCGGACHHMAYFTDENPHILLRGCRILRGWARGLVIHTGADTCLGILCEQHADDWRVTRAIAIARRLRRLQRERARHFRKLDYAFRRQKLKERKRTRERMAMTHTLALTADHTHTHSDMTIAIVNTGKEKNDYNFEEKANAGIETEADRDSLSLSNSTDHPPDSTIHSVHKNGPTTATNTSDNTSITTNKTTLNQTINTPIKSKRNWKSVSSPEGSAEARLRAIGKEEHILSERAQRERHIREKELVHQMKEWTLEQSLPIAS